jgi:uncharacterized protein (DUF433 family)
MRRAAQAYAADSLAHESMISSFYRAVAGHEAMKDFDRITQNPAVMGGRPCIRGMRVTAGMIVGQIGAGETIESLLEGYPYLEKEDIVQALQYADSLKKRPKS